MEVKSNKATPFALSDSAKKKILSLQLNEDKKLFRVYVTAVSYTHLRAHET